MNFRKTVARAAVLSAAAALLACSNSDDVAAPAPVPDAPPVQVPGLDAPPAALGVANSVQQAYRPGRGKEPSTELPPCGTAGGTDCFPGPQLVVQAFPVGQSAAEPTIGVAPDGTVYFAGSTLVVDTPVVYGVSRTDAMKSEDGGLTWTSIQPNLEGNTFPPGNADPMIYVDQTTGRLFVLDLTAVCHFLSYSDDKGATWTTNPLACGNVPVDHQTVVAVTPVGPLATIGYPNMLIWCSNRIADAACGRSFDGGLTWTPGGQPYQLTGATGTACSSLAGHMAADADGRLYLPSAHCGTPEVSVSSDGGLTWQQHVVSDTPSPVAHTSVETDAAGNVYYVWIDDKARPFLAYSKDYGVTWSEPMMIAPPGVIRANFPVVAAGAPGHVAISFPSSVTEKGSWAWDQTVVVSANVLDADPMFTSATANDPALPVHRGECRGRCGGMWDFLDIQISPAGEAWASASFDCHGECLTAGLEVADKVGQGVAIRQIGGPKLR